MTNRYLFPYIMSMIAAIIFVAACPCRAEALPAERYATESRLAKGNWMKISVDRSGLHMIPLSTLRTWGFSDPSKVRVYGYGGKMIPLKMDESTYVDDLPELQSALTQRGLVFYAEGPGEWTGNSANRVHYEPNFYTSLGYYFVGECSDGEQARTIESIGNPGADDPVTTFMDRLHHEQDLTSPGEAGPALVGEDFRYTSTREFPFTTTDAVAGGEGWLECSFVSNISVGSSNLVFKMSGEEIGTTRVSAKVVSQYIHASETVARHSFALPSQPQGQIRIGITFTGASLASSAWLNYLSVLYERNLTMPSAGALEFTTIYKALSLSGATEDLTIWDVTDPLDIRSVDFARDGGNASWTLPAQAGRTYAAWVPSATLPAPKAVGKTGNQNLHGMESVDMVIISPREFSAQAERIAAYHQNSRDSLKVAVVTPELVYNEFSSGMADVSGIRKFFKMLYDRNDGHRLRYAILFGRTTIDNRGLSPSAPTYPTVPAWMPSGMKASLSDNEGYCTDDIMAMLEDGSGSSLGRDKLSISVGRIPATDEAEARQIVDKLLQYAAGARKTAWKQRFLFIADDEDAGTHLRQTERMISQFENDERQQHLVRKVYVDAYPLVGGKTPGARTTMNRYLDEGVVWWNFIGHANPQSWTSEGILTYTDLNSMYLRHWPFIYAATCDFLRLDGNRISGAELLYKERYGGAIGVVSAVRPVFITQNGRLSLAIGRALAMRDADGRIPAPGDIYRTAKNDIRDDNNRPIEDTNRLRYVFIGDPALRLATPSNIARVDSINGIVPDPDAQVTLSALARGTVSGSVTDPAGNVLSGFNGVVLLEIFDAERSVTTLGHGSSGTNDVFEEYGDRVFCGSARVENGRFSINVAMPAELSQNFRPATMSLFAYDTSNDDEAVGLFREFYVYGYDESSAPDTTAPKIESMVLNHSSFRNGDTVNPSPMLIATVSDNIGINVSSAGIGHQITAILDDKTSYSDLSFYYTPSEDGSASGIINYPLENIQPGGHTLRLRVWDTAGNSASSEIEFFVSENMPPKIYDVYTDSNPASSQANFYLSHDQPDVMATVKVTVFDLMGRELWSDTVKGRSDMFLTLPVTWDLCDRSGRRVQRGIYLYRAEITTDERTYQTMSRRIAVTAH